MAWCGLDSGPVEVLNFMMKGVIVLNGVFIVLEYNTKVSELTKNNIERRGAWIQAAWSG